MKNILSIFILLMSTSLFAQNLYPPHWFVGMKNESFQLMIHHKDIAKASDWSLSHPDLSIDSIHIPANANFVLLYIHASQLKAASDITISYRMGKKKKSIPYQLHAKSQWKGEQLDEHDLLYLLMPDRFSNGDPSNDYPAGMLEKRNSRDSSYGRHGGDLKGIQNHLPYLKNLGMTALWLNPVYENDEPLESYHGYAITDHYKIDPRLGNFSDYRNLRDAAAGMGIKMVKDMVFNHVGDQHIFFKDLIDSSWINWWPSYTRTNYRAPLLMDPYAAGSELQIFDKGWFDHHMPDLNTDNVHLRRFLIQQTLWWVAEFKVSALRIDTYAYPGMAFMQLWNKEVKKEFSELFIFGEIWDHGAGVQAWFGNKMNTQNSGLPSLTDFELCWSLHHAFNESPGWNTGLAEVYYTLSQDYMYDAPKSMVTFIDNHDLPRALGVYGKDTLKYQSALSMLLTLRGIPCIYYGSEQLINATGSDDEKRPEWKGGWKGELAPEAYHDTATFQLIQSLAQLRINNPAFDTDARFIQFVPKGGKYVYMRMKGEHGMAVLVSTNRTKTEFRLSDYSELYEAAGDHPLKLSIQGIASNRDAVFYLNTNEVVIIEW